MSRIDFGAKPLMLPQPVLIVGTYDENGILIGEIVNVCADESVITDGKIDTKKLKPITFDPCNNTYIGLGEVVGKAFSDGMKLK